MHYTTEHGTNVTVKHEPAGRIHSIVLKGESVQRENTPKLRYTSRSPITPKVRAHSPRIRAGFVPQDEDRSGMVHLVVNTHKLRVHSSSVKTSNPHSTSPRMLVQEDIAPVAVHSNSVGTSKPHSNSPRMLVQEDISPVAVHSNSVGTSKPHSNSPRMLVQENFAPVAVSESLVEGGNPDFVFDDAEKNKEVNVGKLKVLSIHFHERKKNYICPPCH